jgi:hypothetical protein
MELRKITAKVYTSLSKFVPVYLFHPLKKLSDRHGRVTLKLWEPIRDKSLELYEMSFGVT